MSLLTVLLLASPLVQDERTFEVPDHPLTLTLPALEELVRESNPPSGMHLWSGRLGGVEVLVRLELLDSVEFRFEEPGDVREVVVDERVRRDPRFEPEVQTFLELPFYAPFAGYVEGDLHGDDGEVEGRFLALSGLLPKHGFALEVTFLAPASEEDVAPLRTFLEEGVRYDGPERDPEWTLEEIEARWLRDAPDELHEDFLEKLHKKSTFKKVVTRTKHYLVMTNSSGGKLFAKKLEENYEEITKVFPFEEVEGRRLMPIFLFRTRENYIEFCMKVLGRTRAQAEKSGGHAFRDYYACWYEAPGDPVHIHECTHQIFKNRLRLAGGGSWFQEGVAVYIETSDNERNEVANLVAKGEHTPLRDFVQLASLLHSSTDDIRGGSGAGKAYDQAGLLIEFLRESKFGKDGFEEFLQVLGRVPRGDLARIEAGFQEVYGVTLEELDAAFQVWADKR